MTLSETNVSPSEPHDSPWWRKAFGAGYLDLYAHRDEADAARAVAFLRARLDLTPSARLLDLCCGPGRHLRQIAPLVGWAIGLDLSRHLLDQAAEACARDIALARPDPAPRLGLVEADMRRLPFADATMDVVINLFTSFGYFDADAENAGVIHEIARALRPGGWFALDHINRPHLESALTRNSVRDLATGARVSESRRFDAVARRIRKDVSWRDPDGSVTHWSESVRIYEPDELTRVLTDAGFAPPQIFGDYDAAPLTAASPRMILVARRVKNES